MATGVYGINMPANVTSNDVEIFYNYHLDRSSESVNDSKFNKLPSNCLTPVNLDSSAMEGETITPNLTGVYNLKLPLGNFNKKGFYNVFIRPKEISAEIKDVSSLAVFPDVRGIVIDTENPNLSADMKTDNGLVGYRIEYLSDGKRLPYYRIVTSSFRAESVNQSVSNSNGKSTRYRYNDSGSLIFMTLSPSTSPTFKPNSLPFIGNPNDKIKIINTKFNSVLLDIELVDHDIETVTTMLEGTQIRNNENGLITILDKSGDIYLQKEAYALKETYTSNPIYEIVETKDSIDSSQTLEGIKNKK